MAQGQVRRFLAGHAEMLGRDDLERRPRAGRQGHRRDDGHGEIRHRQIAGGV